MKTLLLLIFSLLTFTTVTSQYFGPKPVLIGDILTKDYQVIYPLGWSKDGTFAYIHQDMNDYLTRDNYYYTVNIQKTKTNEIIWTKQYKSDLENYKHFPSDGTPHNYTFFKLVMWGEIGGEIMDKLNQYKVKIEDDSLHKVADLPSDVSLKEYQRKEEELTNHYGIKLYKNSKFKPVYQFDCKQNKEPCKSNEKIKARTFSTKGYFKSPFENRIAILVFKETNGFEEPFEYPFFVGADLEKGFMDIGCYK